MKSDLELFEEWRDRIAEEHIDKEHCYALIPFAARGEFRKSDSLTFKAGANAVYPLLAEAMECINEYAHCTCDDAYKSRNRTDPNCFDCRGNASETLQSIREKMGAKL